MARETINSLKKKQKKELSEIKEAIWLKCADCRGYFIDGGGLCNNEKCPIRKYFPKKQTIESVSFKKEIAKLASSKGNDEAVVTLILPRQKTAKTGRTRKKLTKKKVRGL